MVVKKYITKYNINLPQDAADIHWIVRRRLK